MGDAAGGAPLGVGVGDVAGAALGVGVGVGAAFGVGPALGVGPGDEDTGDELGLPVGEEPGAPF